MSDGVSSTPSTLFPYQREGVEALIRFLTSEDGNQGALLADPAGAGKSAQAVQVFSSLRAKKVLVVCPKSLKENWRREVARWAGDEYETFALHTSKDHVPDAGKMVVMVNYHLACRQPLLPLLQAVAWDFLILDESHCVRSPTSNVSRVCGVVLWNSARFRLAMTGTPVPNGRASEAWILFRQLAPDLFDDWPAYRDRYCVAVETQWGMTYPRSKNLEELGKLARDRFMVRRSVEEVLGQIPPLVRQTIPLDVPRIRVDEAQAEFEAGGQSIEDVLRAIDAGIPLASDPLSTARRKLGVFKIGPALEFILELLEGVESCVVFAHHREVFFGILEGLKEAEVSVVVISGMTPAAERQQAVDAFQAGEARVFLGSLTAANVGLTLTRSQTVVMVEFDFVPSNNAQAEGRIYRVGQKGISRIFYLVVPDSLDEKVLTAVHRKQRDIERMLAA